MRRYKFNEILIVSLCFILALMSIYSGVISQNVLHTEHCDTTNCQLCFLINIATSFANNFGFVVFSIYAILLSIPFINLVKKDIKRYNKSTLVDLKVILNN